jgi:hypothetical protein
VSQEPWRIEALKRFPELAQEVREAETPYALWIDLWCHFTEAYDSDASDLIARIYTYARWCCEQPRGKTSADDLLTCVSVCFFEHIPTHPKALKDMPKWWTPEDVKTMKQIFSYLGGEAGYAEVLAQYERHKPRRRRKRKA